MPKVRLLSVAPAPRTSLLAEAGVVPLQAACPKFCPYLAVEGNTASTRLVFTSLSSLLACCGASVCTRSR